MAGNVLTYSPSDVTILVSGYQLSGLLSVELAWNSKPFTMYKGIRNQHTRVFNQSMAATLKISVQQTSITNDVLSMILDEDRLGNTARLEVTMKDTSGSTLYQALQCYIAHYPTVTFTSGFSAREWEIDILDMTTINIGGNSKAAFDVFSSVKDALSFL
ncbi:hypothetical protein phiK7A1_077 [Pseudomonas phage phiK7A1]|uniref:Tail tube protein n=1 Tax=Pseudomonas phage phiK7A1 TaxID=2759194 RepID=A0A7H0XFS5_9CAUD|nr:hypothetical protein phiK7A1_077 [Pseudomonas phage phiK7A1]